MLWVFCVPKSHLGKPSANIWVAGRVLPLVGWVSWCVLLFRYSYKCQGQSSFRAVLTVLIESLLEYHTQDSERINNVLSKQQSLKVLEPSSFFLLWVFGSILLMFFFTLVLSSLFFNIFSLQVSKSKYCKYRRACSHTCLPKEGNMISEFLSVYACMMIVMEWMGDGGGGVFCVSNYNLH